MPQQNRQVTITTSPVKINTIPTDSASGSTLTLYNEGAGTVRIGFTQATAATGAPIASGGWSPEFTLDRGADELWAVASADAVVDIYETGI